MAYFQILYFVHDETNPWMVYKLEDKEAKEMVISGRGKLWDNVTHCKVETPTERLDLVEEKAPQAKQNNEWTQTLEELQKLYVEKTGKQLSPAYKNNIEWIKSKLYS